MNAPRTVTTRMPNNRHTDEIRPSGAFHMKASRLSRLFGSILVALVASAGASDAVAQEYGIVRGEVRNENGTPLSGAVVELRTPSTRITTATDSFGNYRLAGIPPGRSLVRATYVGHGDLELEVLVSPTPEIVLDLVLRIRPVALDPVRVESGGTRAATDSVAARDPDLGIAGTRTLEATPGLSELGIADAARGRPVEDPTDPGSTLFVRGAAADLKLVYLDGAPVYAPFPLGGVLDPFTPDVLNRADIYLGGAPARYDGGLSYVMDLRTRTGPGRGVRTSGAVDLLSARILAEGGVGDRVSVLGTARGMLPFAAAGVYGDPLPYDYGEGFLRGDLRIGATGLLSVTGFTNEESVRMGSAAGLDSVVQWGNAAASARLKGRLGSTAAEVTAAFGNYSARLPLAGDNPRIAEGDASRTRLSADFAHGGEVQLRFGASFDRQQYHAAARSSFTDAPSMAVDGAGGVAGIYAEAAGAIGPRVRLRAGGRADHFSTTGDLTFAPRVAATWMVTDRAAMTIAAGRYHQYLRPPDEVLLSDPATNAPPPSASLAVARGSHFTVGLDQDLGDGVRLGIEGFYKEFSNLPGSLALEANASGVDFWVRRGSGVWTGWVGYSLAWVWSSAAAPDEESFTGRHLLSSGLSGKLGERTRIDLRFAYGAGLPYSGIPLETAQQERGTATFGDANVTAANRGGTETAPLLDTPTRPFLRLDAGVSQRWTPRLGSTVFQIEPYLKVLNGLGRRDALFYYFERGGNGSATEIGTLPILPVVGVQWRL